MLVGSKEDKKSENNHKYDADKIEIDKLDNIAKTCTRNHRTRIEDSEKMQKKPVKPRKSRNLIIKG